MNFYSRIYSIVLLLILTSYSLGNSLKIYCAASLRAPLEEFVDMYDATTNKKLFQIQYGGSGVLMNQIFLSGKGDLFISADKTYVNKAKERGFIKEEISVATQRPIILVNNQSNKNISSLEDLLRKDVRVSIADPRTASIGKVSRNVFEKIGCWDELESNVRCFKTTVAEAALDVKIGAVDASIVWDTTARLIHPTGGVVTDKVLDLFVETVSIGVLSGSKHLLRAERFAEDFSVSIRGRQILKKYGFGLIRRGRINFDKRVVFYLPSSMSFRAHELIQYLNKFESIDITDKYFKKNETGMLKIVPIVNAELNPYVFSKFSRLISLQRPFFPLRTD